MGVVMSLASMASVDYLVGHVASGDGRGQRPDSGQGSELTRYYTADGYPPGRWVGSGLAGLADGRGIPVGAEVTESELRALLEDGVDPVTGELLIRRCLLYTSPSPRDGLLSRMPSSA